MKQWEYINKSPTGYTLALVGSSILIKHEKSLHLFWWQCINHVYTTRNGSGYHKGKRQVG